jgi:alanyl-tRNA synthetase
VPGEIYPDAGIRVINFGDFSKELCCGTHAFNTSELIDFTFVNVKSTGRSTYVFTAITGEKAKEFQIRGEEILTKLKSLKEKISVENFSDIMSEVRKVQIQFNKISHLKKLKCLNLISEIKEEIKQKSRNALSELLSVEMEIVKEKNDKNPFVIHYLSCSDFMKSVSLEKATRCIDDKPVIILSLTDDEIKARCVVPFNFVDRKFNAQKWLTVVGKVFNSKVENPRGQDPFEVCFMKGKKIKQEMFDEQLEEAIENAKKFATNNIFLSREVNSN